MMMRMSMESMLMRMMRIAMIRIKLVMVSMIKDDDDDSEDVVRISIEMLACRSVTARHVLVLVHVRH